MIYIYIADRYGHFNTLFFIKHSDYHDYVSIDIILIKLYLVCMPTIYLFRPYPSSVPLCSLSVLYNCNTRHDVVSAQKAAQPDLSFPLNIPVHARRKNYFRCKM